MTQTTGFGKGRPTKLELNTKENPLGSFLSEDKSLEQSIIDAVKTAYWLGAEDEGSVRLSLVLARQLILQENRTHQIAPVLISLLGNLGLLYGSRESISSDPVGDFLEELRSNEVATH